MFSSEDILTWTFILTNVVHLLDENSLACMLKEKMKCIYIYIYILALLKTIAEDFSTSLIYSTGDLTVLC